MTNDYTIHGRGFITFLCAIGGLGGGLLTSAMLYIGAVDLRDAAVRREVRQEAVDAGVAVWEADQKTGETNFRWLSATEWKEPDAEAPDA